MHFHVHTFTHGCTHIYIYTHPHPSMYTHTYKHTTHACSCAHMHTWIPGHIYTHTHARTHYVCMFMHIHAHMDACTYDLVPKGVQEKRTEVLENKVDRMWVSNAFFEWTREVVHHWRVKGKGSAALRSWEIWLSVWYVTRIKMLNITHYNKPTLGC